MAKANREKHKAYVQGLENEVAQQKIQYCKLSQKHEEVVAKLARAEEEVAKLREAMCGNAHIAHALQRLQAGIAFAFGNNSSNNSSNDTANASNDTTTRAGQKHGSDDSEESAKKHTIVLPFTLNISVPM